MAERTYLRGRVMRVTKLDGCGNVVLGPDSKIVSDGFISIGLTPNTQAGEAIQLDNAWGERKIDETPTPRFVNFTGEFNFIGVNPDLLAMMTGQPVVLNADGDDVVGFRINSKVNVDLLGFAVEFWTAVGGDVCDSEFDQQWGYGLLPFFKGGTIGAISVSNGAINFTVTGAQSRNGSQWGVGPYDVVPDENGNPGPLNEPIDPLGDHLHMETTPVTPPTATDGEPGAIGVVATGATAGTPGTFTPVNSYAPADFAGLQAATLTKNPNTAWTTGQRVVLRDGSTAHWNGTAWVVGPA